MDGASHQTQKKSRQQSDAEQARSDGDVGFPVARKVADRAAESRAQSVAGSGTRQCEPVGTGHVSKLRRLLLLDCRSIVTRQRLRIPEELADRRRLTVAEGSVKPWVQLADGLAVELVPLIVFGVLVVTCRGDWCSLSSSTMRIDLDLVRLWPLIQQLMNQVFSPSTGAPR